MRSRSLVLLIASFCLILSACGNTPDPVLTITFPLNGSTIYVSQNSSDQPYYWHWSPGNITMSVDVVPRMNNSACPYPPAVFQPRDNGGSFRGVPITPIQTSCSTVEPSREASYTWIPNTLGLHTLTTELVVFLSDGTQKVFTSNSITICVLNDPIHPAQNIEIGPVSADCNPTFSTVTPSLTVTPSQTVHHHRQLH